MSRLRDLLRRYPVRVYFALTLTLSWSGLLLVGGSGLLAGSDWRTDPRFLPAIQVMLLGPLVAGLLCTALAAGRAGLRDLLARLARWRVAGRWYAVALLAAPLVQGGVLLALSLRSPLYLPAIATTSDRTTLLLSALAYGLIGALVEEVGWTGFAVPRLRARYGVLATGIGVGLVWGAWHGLQMWWVGSTSFGTVPPGIFLPAYMVGAVAALAAYRVLMVWVYDRTESLLIAVLMHASYIASTLFILAPPTTGMPFLVYSGAFVGVLWGAVVVALRRGG